MKISATLPATPVDTNASRSISPRMLAAVFAAAVLPMVGLYFAVQDAVKPDVERHAALLTADKVPPEVEAMVERLAARLKNEPNNAGDWQMLGRSYAALGRYSNAVVAYRRAAELLPADANILADYADVLAMSRSGNFSGEPVRLIRQALKADPQHAKALALAGTEAYQRNDRKAALQYWLQALAHSPEGSELAISVKSGIDELMGKS